MASLKPKFVMNTNQQVVSSYPLTASGINEVMKDLQAIPQFELEAEAAELKSNFKGWMAERFD